MNPTLHSSNTGTMTALNSSHEKIDVLEAELGTRPKIGEVERVEAMATAPGVTLESFAHINEKKLLRKVSMDRDLKLSEIDNDRWIGT